MNAIPQFGNAPDGETAEERPGTYAIALSPSRNELLVVEYRRRFFLPGGGKGHGESDGEALRREVLEETGYTLQQLHKLAEARQFVVEARGKRFNKLCAFYLVRLGPRVGVPTSPGHFPRWVPVEDGFAGLAEEASIWALRLALGQP